MRYEIQFREQSSTWRVYEKDSLREALEQYINDNQSYFPPNPVILRVNNSFIKVCTHRTVSLCHFNLASKKAL